MIFFETENFVVETHEQPFVTRIEGGHLRISIKDKSITDRTKLSPKAAVELIRLTMIVGQALEEGMNKQGIPVVKVNYQDMCNWSYKDGKLPYLHVHILGRAQNAAKQPFPESVYLPDRTTGFYDGFEPLNSDDIKVVKAIIERLFKEKKYQDKEWRL